MSKSYTQINLLPDNSRWVTSWENKALKQILSELDFEVKCNRISYRQVCYLPSKYFAASYKSVIYHFLGNRLAFDYYHGDPSISPEFSPLLDTLKRRKHHFHRIRVPHSGIETLLKNEGFDQKVFRIPIGINLDWFPFKSLTTKKLLREKYNIPQSAVVIGSFQKDGNGWGDGNEPKYIKGPDIFLKAIEILKSQIPELLVLLTGPSRGYMKRGLEDLKVPYRHYVLNDYREIGNYYQVLDAYIIASREEGGPKAVLEAMASGVPLVSTRVGQAQDLIQHGVNGWLVDVSDVEALAEYTFQAVEKSEGINSLVQTARQTAELNAYNKNKQQKLWYDFFLPLVTK
ncbi:glycosyltransferase [Nodularia spumigena CS-584]|jgi:glycosyltransferase involved in cell wall biosynthesis|uniref:glycosyltransferase family 4 protein n=1 Tax=Nodularia spumigena TaxID=70799 RepID=UPI0000EA92F0|nr:glycosyltransferase [Nodularia spumigena]AHJ31307.1 Glycosyl transferase, group 1 [Nodularia spumigena CCY9414]EAW44785.1 predicted glycosyltransferase [Nodularia spumigena CCY9414]MDB9380725.1 glycosyltransferase [Nodularia spumigena CS-584]